jgi:hypothetical protein
METQAARRIDQSSGPGLEPEMILPSQFFDHVGLDASLQPEKRLMLAVLEDAVGTFQKFVTVSTRRGQRLFAEAEEWFSSPSTEWPFDFENVCEALGMEASFLRAGLWRWRDAQRGPAPASAKVVRFPFRRVNGRRHTITGRPVGLRHSA